MNVQLASVDARVGCHQASTTASGAPPNRWWRTDQPI